MPNKITMDNFDKVAEDLFEFVKKETFTNDEPIGLETRLEEDLGVYGDDAVEFMLKYSEKYKVDVTHFMAADYFSPESRSTFGTILSSLFGKEKSSKKILKVVHLYHGIKRGKLDEEVISLSDAE